MSKMGRHILAKQEEELNKHRQVAGGDSNLHDYERIKETIQENKFSLCHLGADIVELYKEYPNDAELGKHMLVLLQTRCLDLLFFLDPFLLVLLFACVLFREDISRRQLHILLL